MTDYIHELYQLELDSGRLSFEDDPDYRDTIHRFSQQYETVWQAGDHKLCEQLYSSCLELADDSARAAFHHGMRLGMALVYWSMRLSGL